METRAVLSLTRRLSCVQPSWRSLTDWPGRAVPAVLYAAVVFAASVADPPSGGLPLAGPFGLVGVDKWIHVGTYAALAVLVAYALWTTTSRRLIAAVVVASAYGLGIEVVQSVLPLRAFELLDVLANTLGALLAAVVLWVLSHRTALVGEKETRSS